MLRRRGRQFAGWLAGRDGIGRLLLVGLNDAGNAQKFIAIGEGDEADALAATIHFADRVDGTPDALPLGGEEHNFVRIFNAERSGEFD